MLYLTVHCVQLSLLGTREIRTSVGPRNGPQAYVIGDGHDDDGEERQHAQDAGVVLLGLRRVGHVHVQGERRCVEPVVWR